MQTIKHSSHIFLLKTIWSIRILLAGNRLATKLFLRALRYWRILEFPYTLAKLPKQDKLEILDISSPKFLAIYIAKKFGHNVTAIDIWDKEIEHWKEILRLSKPFLNIADNITLAVEDATCLSYADESFDFVYSVSVFEHIDGLGDTKGLQEISRVLRKGGIAVVTVPYDKKGYDVFKNENIYHKGFDSSPVFYERWYNKKQLHERLINASPMLELLELRFIYEKFLPVHNQYIPILSNSSYIIRNLWSTFEPLFALLNLSTTSEISPPEKGVALLTFRKHLI